MMRLHTFILILFTLLPVHAFAHKSGGDDFIDTINLFKQSKTVQPFFDTAYGYAVFPTVGKGGFWLGASFGKGRVYSKKMYTGNVTMFKATLGFQVGGQAFSEIIFFKNKSAYDSFVSGNFEFDATLSAVAITAAAQATAGSEGVTAGASVNPKQTNQAVTRYHKGVAVFTHTKGGFMYEASLGGQTFTFTPATNNRTAKAQ